ncbi:MAG: arginine--tRNA ligase [Firmicutes bacterium]|nr:arginine--tRNA ligase [Bacillota bacterium]
MEGHTYHFYNLEKQLQEKLWEVLKGEHPPVLDKEEIPLEVPPQPEFGDLSSPLPLKLAGTLRRPPLSIAEKMQEALQKDLPPLVKDITVTAPGYINFHLDYTALTRSFFDAVAVEKEKYGETKGGKGKKLVIEHTNINPNKAAHIGHLRNACLGDTLARMKRKQGYEVEVRNYIDDTGAAVADIVVGLYHLKRECPRDMPFDRFCWDLYAEVNRLYEEDPALKEKEREVLRQIEAGDNEVAHLAKEVAGKIVGHHLDIMWHMGVYYNLLTWESDILHLGFWEHAWEKLREGGSLVYEEEGPNAGCWVVQLGDLEEFQDLENPDKVLVRSNGTATYTAKDIAYQMWKFGILGQDFLYDRHGLQPNGTVLWTTAPYGNKMTRFGQADEVINVIDLRQKYLQDVLRLSLHKLGFEEEAAHSIHFAYEVVSLSAATARELGVEVEEGKKEIYAMSGRDGIGVKAGDMLARMTKKATGEVAARHPEMTPEEHRKLAQDIAIGAIRYYMIKYNMNSIIVFDFNEALSMQGNTGPYLQYAYARAANILGRVEPEVAEEVDLRDISIPDELVPLERELIRRMADFPTILSRAAQLLQPSLLAEYTYNLAATFMNFYEEVPVLTAHPHRMRFRVALLQAFRQTLGNALYTLGIPAMLRM